MTRIGKNNIENKKKKVVLNQLVRTSSKSKIDEKYNEIVSYCEKNNFDVPAKGIFISDWIDESSLSTISPEAYIKNY